MSVPVSGCGGRAEEVDRTFHSEPEECIAEIGQAVYGHACQHGRQGPFSEVEAVPEAGLIPPEVDTLQHVFDISFPEEDRSEDGVWFVAFTPARNGEHAIFSGFDGEALGLRVLVDGEARERLHEEPVEQPDNCGEMTTVTVVQLEKGVRTTIALGPTEAKWTRVFFEHMPTFGTGAWEKACE